MTKSTIDTSASRTRTLNKVKLAVATGKDEDARAKAVRSRLRRRARNLVPARSDGTAGEQVALFREQAEAVAATMAEVGSAENVPQAVADYLRENNLPASIKHGDDPALIGLPWQKTPTLERTSGPAVGDDQVSLSHAVAGVAETGTLIMTSGPDNPTTLNFLPETHIVMLDRASVVGAYEDAWDVIREAHGSGKLPRTVNMISGPSRTADVEQTIQLGAHGPRRLHIVIVGKP